MTEKFKLASVKKLPAGTVVVSENHIAAKEMVIVLQGNINVFKNYGKAGETLIKTIGQGEFHCEYSLFLNCPHDESLVAATDVLLLKVNRSNVREFFINCPDMAISIVETICKRQAKIKAEAPEEPETSEEGKTGEEEQKPSENCRLFPDGHGSYVLPLTNNNADVVYSIKSTCPICKHSFDNLWVMSSKLRRVGTDPDWRVRYKDVEPLYYDVTTCPNCLFSAESASFSEVSGDFSDAANRVLGTYRNDISIKVGRERDTFTVFAGYYLALLCAPAVLVNHELATAGLWNKLRRLYQDCKDDKMQMFAVNKALDAYNHVYTKTRITDKQTQQVRYILGELNLKVGNLDAAREYLYLLKRSPDTPDVMKRQVEIRIDDISEMKKQAEAEQQQQQPQSK